MKIEFSVLGESENVADRSLKNFIGAKTGGHCCAKIKKVNSHFFIEDILTVYRKKNIASKFFNALVLN